MIEEILMDKKSYINYIFLLFVTSSIGNYII